MDNIYLYEYTPIESHREIRLIQFHCNTVREQKRKLNVEQLRQKYQPEHQQENWDALQNFFQQKWWDRIWTLQEYALAKDGDVQFWCGLHIIPRPAIEDALWVADKCHNVSLKRTLAFHRAYNRRRIRLVHALVHKKQTKRTISLVALAAYSACFNAKDPRDRLYGIMALGTDASLFDVSYDIGVEETYARFVQSFIKHYNSLDIICFASLWSAQPNSSLPSWIPDWRTRVDPFVVPLMVSQSANTHIGNLRGPTYTSTRSSPEPALPSDVMARSICKTLVLDRKDRYLRFPEPDEFFQDFMWLCEKVLAGKGADVPKDFRTWFGRTKNLSIRGRKLEEVLRDSIDAKHGHWSVRTPNQDESHMETFFSRFYDSIVYMSLRLMITNQGGSA
ncbi:heterokaryon incompatibility protein-domain-containing protein [Apiospora saccharicola]